MRPRTRATLRAAAAAGALAVASGAMAGDWLQLPLDHALGSDLAHARLMHLVPLYWAGQPHPQPLRDLGLFRANEGTNSTSRPDQEACDRALLSALYSLQVATQEHGGNAVIAIHDDGATVAPAPGQYACEHGLISTKVRLRGRMVRLPQPQ